MYPLPAGVISSEAPDVGATSLRSCSSEEPRGIPGAQTSAQLLMGVQLGDHLPETDGTRFPLKLLPRYLGSATGELVKKARVVLPSLIYKIQVKQTGNEAKSIRNYRYPS